MKNLLSYILLIIIICSCNKKSADIIKKEATDLDQLVELMTGYYNSSNQASLDSAFYDISLNMHQIWLDNEDAKWLYVEQAVTSNIKSPYRQRIYRVNQNSGVFESSVYELSDPDKYIHAWENIDVFDDLTPEQITEREGCTVFLEQRSGGCFNGSTKKGACLSSLRGASYATSIVEICQGVIVSWDQGWNEEGEQVWGAVKSGYIFDKIEKD
jgi:hypothetical protein